MKFRFWGVRGSLPCPETPEAVRAKVSTIINRVQSSDLVSPESRERFLAGLPPELFGSIGGNTTCFEVEGSPREILVVDAGTGLRELGTFYESSPSSPKHYHIFFTHFHWDHLQGLPFFQGLFQRGNTISFYSPMKGFEKWVRQQMDEPFFPVPLSVLPARMFFVELDEGPLVIAGTQVRWRSVNHPGSCVCYRFERDGKSLIFSTDTELRVVDFDKSPENLLFYDEVDVLVMDAQYTLDEAIERPDWGHSSSGLAVEFALDFHAKTLYLFHHEPNHDDSRIEEIGRLAQWYADHKRPGGLKVLVAREGRKGHKV